MRALGRIFALSALILGCDGPQGGEAGDSPTGKADDPGGGDCAEANCDAAAAWGLSDVSVLFPIEDEDVPNLLGTSGEGFTLLDEDVFKLLGTEATFLTETPNRDQHYDKLRVTAFRLDPCVDGFDPHAAECERAIRLVMQPIWPIGDTFDVFDASIHLFYALDSEQWAQLLADYTTIRSADLSALPLTVHPVLESERAGGEFGLALNKLIVQYATVESMTKMTFMATGRSGNNWFWGAFERQEDGSYAAGEIPDVGELDSFHQNGRDRETLVEHNGDFPFAFLTNPSLDALDGDEVEAGLQQLYAIENPKLFNPTNVRCAWCHLSAETKAHVLARRELDELETPERYTADGLDLSVAKEDENRGFNMHAFSYFRDAPTISQRVANDSAEVVQFLNRER